MDDCQHVDFTDPCDYCTERAKTSVAGRYGTRHACDKHSTLAMDAHRFDTQMTRWVESGLCRATRNADGTWSGTR